MVREAILRALRALITLSALVEDNVNDLVMLADILGRLRHELVDNLAEECYIAAGIPAYSRYQLGDSALVLLYVSECAQVVVKSTRTSEISSKSITSISCSRLAILCCGYGERQRAESIGDTLTSCCMYLIFFVLEGASSPPAR